MKFGHVSRNIDNEQSNQLERLILATEKHRQNMFQFSKVNHNGLKKTKEEKKIAIQYGLLP